MDILTDITNNILTIQFNRPHKKNSITAAMYQTMADALHNANEDPSVRVILFRGKEGVFSAGNDLIDFKEMPPIDSGAPVFQFLRQISSATKPIIAAVSGLAIGIGTTLLLHCDLVYASENATFSLPFAQLGLCPEAASSLLLPRLIGHQRAAEKLLLGEPFSAREAFELGLVNRLLPAGELDAFALEQASKLAALPASSMRATKALMKRISADEIAEQINIENNQFRVMLQSPEAREAISAFFEKRKPDFSKMS
ncbi:MAG: enoyl-CoA hydratase [Gammaproteobacteria bacterium]|nr:enoyl-CoA hydratase [Gammaproteobacteria bacterium]